MIDMIGVIPLPTASKQVLVRPVASELPEGSCMVRIDPGTTLSHSQFDAYPPATRLTVTVSASSRSGLPDNE
ncbi:hypothetical protein ACFYO1_01825 [Nocardia sp. NPDC006044]|uniref:hypothetical protein n=1 Tax=Nocardia sp. NPDC006044 TaxID=3364306 RepID=UPI0036C15E99